MLLLAVTLPFHSTFLARLVAVPFAVGTCVRGLRDGARARGRPGCGRCSPAVRARRRRPCSPARRWSARTPTRSSCSSSSAAVLILRPRREEERWIAAVAVGLALGTKWYALTVLPPLGADLARRRAGRGRAACARMAAIAGGVGGIWMLRNWILAGNPLFPQPLGLNAPRDIYRETAGSSLARLRDGLDVWRDVPAPAVQRPLRRPGAAARRRPAARAAPSRRVRGRSPSLPLAAMLAYAVTPYSALGPARARPWRRRPRCATRCPASPSGAMVLATAPRLVRPGRRARARSRAVARHLRAGPAHRGGPARRAGHLAVSGRRSAAPRLAAAGRCGGRGGRRRRDPRTPGATAPATRRWPGSRPTRRPGTASPSPATGACPASRRRCPPSARAWATRSPTSGRSATTCSATSATRGASGPRLRGYDLVVVGRGFAPTAAPAPEEAWARAAGFEPVVASDRLAVLLRAVSQDAEVGDHDEHRRPQPDPDAEGAADRRCRPVRRRPPARPARVEEHAEQDQDDGDGAADGDDHRQLLGQLGGRHGPRPSDAAPATMAATPTTSRMRSMIPKASQPLSRCRSAEPRSRGTSTTEWYQGRNSEMISSAPATISSRPTTLGLQRDVLDACDAAAQVLEREDRRAGPDHEADDEQDEVEVGEDDGDERRDEQAGADRHRVARAHVEVAGARER